MTLQIGPEHRETFREFREGWEARIQGVASLWGSKAWIEGWKIANVGIEDGGLTTGQYRDKWGDKTGERL